MRIQELALSFLLAHAIAFADAKAKATLATATTSLPADDNTADPQALWDKHDYLFGKRLRTAFQNVHSLSVAVQSASTHCSGTSTTPSTSIVCSAYSAAYHITNSFLPGSTQPYIVDLAGDKTCFLVWAPCTLSISPLNATANITMTPVPHALKINENVYHYIEGGSSPNAISVRDLTMILATNETMVETHSLVTSIQRSLHSYELSALDSFFWTAPSTAAVYHADLRLLDTPDHTRLLRWRKVTGHIDSLRSGNSTTDPCSFNTIKFDIQKSRITFLDIKTEPTMTDAGCIAFLTATLASQSAAWHISFTERPKITNFRARSIQQTYSVGQDTDSSLSPYTHAGLIGTNQVVSIADTGLDTRSCYFYDSNKGGTGGPPASSNLASPYTDMSYRKVVQYSYVAKGGDTYDVFQGHGSHVSGIAVGSIEGGNIYSENNGAVYGGVAPGAKIAFLDLSNNPSEGISVPNVALLFNPGYSAGSRVHSNSWGVPFSSINYYDAAELDGYLFAHPEMTILHSAGNDGQHDGLDGRATISIEAQAKNVIAVGSSETTFYSANITYVAFYSSKGPAVDGRIKPDLVGPGDALNSVASQGGNGNAPNGQCSSELIDKSGTSMAAPAVAGSAILIRQYFIDGASQYNSGCHYSYCDGITPSGVLVKATLLHSGSALTLFNGGGPLSVPIGSPPDMVQGYGLVTLRNVLPLSSANYNFDLFIDDLQTAHQNSMITYYVNIQAFSVPLKVTVSWYDPPAVDGSTESALIHDLDLILTSPSGMTYYGNGGNQADRLNNNEQVFVPLSSAETGSWKVTVTARTLVVQNLQLFSIVITSSGTVSSTSSGGGGGARPTAYPTERSNARPTAFPTEQSKRANPTAFPTDRKLVQPTAYPTDRRKAKPTAFPTDRKLPQPTAYPTDRRKANPTAIPTGRKYRRTSRPTRR